MHLEILTPDKTLFSGEVENVIVPGSKGQFQILNNHAALISSLEKGTVKISTKQGKEQFEILGGVVEVLKNRVVILA